MISRDEAKAILISLLPPGSDQLYDLANTAVIGGTLYGLAGALKDVLLDRVDQLKLELNPSTMVEKIPEWEAACGLTNTPIAKFGTIAQRRNAVLAVLRTSGSFSYDDIRAIVQPYLLYADPTQIQIVETSRSTLRAAHTYPFASPYVITPPGRVKIDLNTPGNAVRDDPKVSPGGAHLVMNVDGDVGGYAFTLQGPDGTSATFLGDSLLPGSGTGVSYDLGAPAFAGKAIYGKWVLIVDPGTASITLNTSGVFVEGLGVNYDIMHRRVGEGLGSAMFEFAVIADPAKLGTGYDLQGASRSLSRWKPAHTQGAIVVASGVMTASYYAIPDTVSATPDAAIPGP